MTQIVKKFCVRRKRKTIVVTPGQRQWMTQLTILWVPPLPELDMYIASALNEGYVPLLLRRMLETENEEGCLFVLETDGVHLYPLEINR
jgi:hypothetical protein